MCLGIGFLHSATSTQLQRPSPRRDASSHTPVQLTWMYRCLIFEDAWGFSIKALIEYFAILSTHIRPNTRRLLTESVSSYIIYHLGPSPRTAPFLMRGRYRLIALVSVEKCMSINSSHQRHWGKVFLKDLFTECLSLHPPPTYYTGT